MPNALSTAVSRRPRAAAAAVLLVLTLGVTGCGAAGDRSSAAQEKSAADDSRGGYQQRDMSKNGRQARSGSSGSSSSRPGSSARTPRVTVAHLIRTASLTVRVSSVPEAVEKARDAAERAGGYVGDETTTRDRDGRERSRLVLRVPQDAYQETLDDLAGTGTVVRQNVDTKDVTDQVVDVESRIRSQKASVERVRALMKDATELQDVVLLEGELNSRQTELEALQAQQASLKERTAMATIRLALSDTAVAEDDEPTFTGALAGGWDAFVTAGRWVAVAFGAALPFAVTGALLWALVRFARARWGGRRSGVPAFVPAPAAPAGPAASDEPAARTAGDAGTGASGDAGGEDTGGRGAARG